MSNARGIADSDLSRLTVDSTTLVVDDTNNRVGIGTSSPACKTDVAGVIRSTSIGAPASGAGLELSYGGTANTADILAYDRTGAAFKNLELRCSNLIFNTGGGGERMRIDSAGRVTMPYQPAFKAGRTAGDVSATSTVVFNVVTTNIGGHYNSSTGAFTTPIAGRYLFTAGLFSNHGTNVYTEIRVNGSTVSWTIYTGSGYGQASHSVVLDLNANDAVTVVVSGGQLYAGGSTSDCYFSGILLG